MCVRACVCVCVRVPLLPAATATSVMQQYVVLPTTLRVHNKITHVKYIQQMHLIRTTSARRGERESVDESNRDLNRRSFRVFSTRFTESFILVV